MEANPQPNRSLDAQPHDGPPREPAPASRRGNFAVLRHRHFRVVWLASFGSNVGGWMEVIGVQWAMAQATLAPDWVAAGHPSAPIMMGYLAAAQTGPILLLGLLGGVVADRVNRKRLLLVTQSLLAIIAAALAVEAYFGAISPFVLLMLGLVNGVVLAFNMPAWGVLTPRLVPREELSDAIVLNGLQFNMARVVGPALGGVLMGWAGPVALFAINAVSFVGVIAAVATTPDAPPPAEARGRSLALLREAFVTTWTNRGMWALTLGIFVFSMLATPLLRLLPVIIKDVYQLEADAYGTLLAIMGAGAVIGALSVKRIPQWYPKHHFIPLSIMLGGLCVGLTAAAPGFWMAAPAIFFCGVFWMWTFNTSFASLQLLVEDRMRGRIFSIANVLSFGAMPLGALLAGFVGGVVVGGAQEGFQAQIGLAACAGVLTLAGAVMLTWRTPEIDGLRPGEPGYDRTPGLVRGVTASAHRQRDRDRLMPPQEAVRPSAVRETGPR